MQLSARRLAVGVAALIFTLLIASSVQAERTSSRKTTSGRSPSLTSVVAWQAALDRAGFSPGVIDGNWGRRADIALRAFQEFSGLPATGQLDDASRKALGITGASPLEKYVITSWDAKSVGALPKTWQAKAKVARLGHESLAALVAERGHCTVSLLSRLNPGVRVDRLNAGDALLIPCVAPKRSPQASRLVVDFGEKTIAVQDKSGRTIGLFHCSIAKEKRNRPGGACRVATVSRNPHYWFDPAKWPEVKDVKTKLLIPPGPRNPVGVCWIGLSIDGYGIHGSPAPELIGKTGSHGCFRLTNWDAQRLGNMVRVGTSVRFTESTSSKRRA
jgi:lipoprotein-anchoring transpeptidase ErfK/SrfK